MNDNKIRTKFTEMSKIFKDVIDEYESLKNENLRLRLRPFFSTDLIQCCS